MRTPWSTSRERWTSRRTRRSGSPSPSSSATRPCDRGNGPAPPRCSLPPPTWPGAWAALASALSPYCDTIATPEYLDERLAASEEMVGLAREAGDRELELLGLRFRVESLFQAGDISALDAAIEAYARLAEVLRQPISQWYVPLFRGARALMEGRFRDSERLARQALEMGERAQSTNARMMADYTQLTQAFRQAGRVEGMEGQWQRVV